MRKLFLLILLPLMVYAQDHKTPEQIQQELNDAEDQFKMASEMFNPWYAGPLVTPSASMMPVGSANIQPYLFITGNYASYNKERKASSLAHNSYSVLIIAPMQVGITDSTDLTINPAASESWQNHETGGGFNDLGVTYGFKIQEETLYIPKFKFTLSELFPTGKYQNLSFNGLALNATGGGAFVTTFGIAMGKMIWWTYPYPISTRSFIGYSIPTTVHVKNFNNYGGGFGTSGTVRPGNKLTCDLGVEVAFSQNWVFALDLTYTATNSTHFHGKLGTTTRGGTEPASMGSPYSDSMTVAPAIEYNFSDVLQILWGAQFSVYGRSSTAYVNGQFSVEYMW